MSGTWKKKFGTFTAAWFVCLGAVAFNTQAALVERLDGAAYFDEDTGLTWLTDASASGFLTWQSALDWAGSLDVNGTTGWRLPTADPTCALGTTCPTSEMGHLFSEHGITASNSSPFTGVEFDSYWTATLSTSDDAYQFAFANGLQFDNPIGITARAMAVLDGDPAVIPVPAAAWLFASGLLGLIGFARRS